MQFSRIFLLGSVALAATACSESDVSKIVTPDASAAIRWVNAIPDTVGMDYRVVDYPSNASEPNLLFGTSSGNWRIIPAGSHHVQAFFSCPSSLTGSTGNPCQVPAVVQTVIDDATFNLEAGKKYTILHYGFAKSGATPAKKMILIEDIPPVVPAGQVAIRVINAAAALGTVSVYSNLAAATGGVVPGSASFSSVAPGTASAWVNFPVATGTNSYRISATAPGSTTALVDFLAPAGVAAVAATPTTGPLDAVPGARIDGSAFTIVIFGPRVAYTLSSSIGGGPVAGSATGAAATLLDRWPTRISP
ncbi:MAG TPA: DUF4397 domain-containing protein [Gemmatimonadaceae bacterium]|nr:DUF4397 domain-containing protein [Gemmatimonadaceae bacterium]